ncbi:MAG TPA: sugar-binding transcriptional regulator [Candidatus Binatia bacterium]|nr:sugar-binding transcriptional regulator [Candidatus Binatia bacterium]
MAVPDNERSKLDDAARAGWLYYIAGNTQDEIAKKLKVSRATAQRLVSLCLSERLITFKLEHPIAACMELAARLTDKYQLRHCEVVPTDAVTPTSVTGVAQRAAALLEATLRAEKPAIVAIGTGRTMRAAVEQIPPMDCPNHQVVSLVGNISPDGSASFFDTLARLADLTNARHYPMPLPVFVASDAERQQLLKISPVSRVRALAEQADLRLVGIGQIDQNAQVVRDGFITRDELLEMLRLGAVGEVIAWAIDAEGRIIRGGTNKRLTSMTLPVPATSLTVGAALGPSKIAPIRAALKGRIVNGLITDEATAKALLKS